MSAPAVRVIGGRWKGRRLEAGAAARPTSSRARGALFDILGERIAAARVLDLYAGTGAVGIEAVSRGARSAVLVETDAAPLRRTVDRLGAANEIEILAATAGEALAALDRRGERFDLIFADPPYAASTEPGELDRCGDLLAPGGLLVLQQDARREEPSVGRLERLDRRAYGRNVFLFFGMR
ncbi:MAG TPA: RsmD family RNA methyltransferase [Thermoanaerobaculia bacterium]|nr:RsmD family RNA methyltransferase [Thermoanaerobaculia bacterium]